VEPVGPVEPACHGPNPKVVLSVEGLRLRWLEIPTATRAMISEAVDQVDGLTHLREPPFDFTSVGVLKKAAGTLPVPTPTTLAH
jgi:hypothetical protein